MVWLKGLNMWGNSENLEFRDNQLLELAVLSVIGDRSEQQDCYGFDVGEAECFAAVCDGMGGHRGGSLASRAAVDYLLDRYRKNMAVADPIAFLREISYGADGVVTGLTDENGRPMEAGSTMVTVFIRGNELYWASVGDSRLYLIRGEEIVQVTLDHNYHEYLKERLFNKEISQEDFERENVRGEALINYLGMNGLLLTDHNEAPLALMSGDKLLVMSDGLYRLVGDNEIYEILSNFGNIKEALESLELKAQRVAHKTGAKRDNMTVMLIKIK